ncbi:OmpA family protein [Tamlana sp. 2201CG12-4]|uniref:OmpA family protein n=1 Tax=Tamlana sp. 2201CG12-4 TaxID=3112582 RepID=UPI002DB66563|nr:OmpA family protein [Tamlana sp. 2201CG12-4]MEC3906465.1 OmpA family protein [Tamlana sp. 2201CG12-4]
MRKTLVLLYLLVMTSLFGQTNDKTLTNTVHNINSISNQSAVNIKHLQSNSKYSEFGGFVNSNDNSVTFSSSRKIKSERRGNWNKNNEPLLRVFKGTIGEGKDISEISVISKDIKAKYHESNACYTKDGKTVYFTRNNYDGEWLKPNAEGKSLLQLYRATVTESGDWTDVVSMSFNNDDYQVGHPALNETEDKLYFISNMPGSIGQTDIYYVDIINKGASYGIPKNLGPHVNTRDKEMFPLIHHNILVFASDGYTNGLGKLDLYYVQIEDGKPQPATHFENAINSKQDDFAMFFVGDDASQGYFSSSREGGKGSDDMYFFEDLEIKEFKKDPDNNKEEGALALNQNKAPKEDIGKLPTTQSNPVEPVKTAPKLDKKDKERRDHIDIETIHFRTNEYHAVNNEIVKLNGLVDYLKANPDIKVICHGYADSRGTDDYNINLSKKRAETIKLFLLSKGINISRIRTVGHGENNILNHCVNGVDCIDEEHAINRHVDFELIEEFKTNSFENKTNFGIKN